VDSQAGQKPFFELVRTVRGEL